MTIDCRTALYMPALKERVLAKGPLCAADAVILDLEDSVAPESKQKAREQALKALRELDYGYRLRALRINAADTPWYKEDIAVLVNAESGVQPDAVVLPKVESDQDVRELSRALDSVPGGEDIAIWAMMESPLAVLNAHSIAQCAERCPRLSMLIVGTNDLVREAGMPFSSDRTLLVPWMMSLVAAARAYRLNILDGVFNDFSDEAGFLQECRQGAAMGMDGKSLIHPAQIATANKVYSPSAEAVADAESIVAAFNEPANQQAGVVQVEGRMVERLHLEMANQLLSRVKRLSNR